MKAKRDKAIKRMKLWGWWSFEVVQSFTSNEALIAMAIKEWWICKWNEVVRAVEVWNPISCMNFEVTGTKRL